MQLVNEAGFESWYEANMAWQPFTSEAHKAGARAAWLALGSRVLDVAESLQPQQYSNESDEVALAKANIATSLLEIV